MKPRGAPWGPRGAPWEPKGHGKEPLTIVFSRPSLQAVFSLIKHLSNASARLCHVSKLVAPPIRALRGSWGYLKAWSYRALNGPYKALEGLIKTLRAL